MKNHILCVVLLIVTLEANASESAPIYVTDNGKPFNGLFLESKERGTYLNPEKLAASKTNRESLPAQNFPEGNWGIITNGYQLSLRFTKSSYTNGEPVTAILLFRNATNQIRNDDRYLRNIGLFDGPARFQIVSASGQILSERQPQLPMAIQGGNVSNEPYPQTQHKYLERINRGYDLQNGQYTIKAYIELFGGWAPVRIESAAVPVKIGKWSD